MKKLSTELVPQFRTEFETNKYRFDCRTLLIILGVHIYLREKPRNMMSTPIVNKRGASQIRNSATHVF